jgi:hypothetical protein
MNLWGIVEILNCTLVVNFLGLSIFLGRKP